MKKGLIWTIVAFALALVIGLTILIAVNTNRAKNASVGENNTVYELDGIKEKYTKGKNIVFKLVVTSDVELTGLSYSLNNSEEVVLESETGLNVERGTDKLGTGKYYIDSSLQVIETTSLSTGYYVIAFYATNEAGTRYLIGEPAIIRIDAATSAA